MGFHLSFLFHVFGFGWELQSTGPRQISRVKSINLSTLKEKSLTSHRLVFTPKSENQLISSSPRTHTWLTHLHHHPDVLYITAVTNNIEIFFLTPMQSIPFIHPTATYIFVKKINLKSNLICLLYLRIRNFLKSVIIPCHTAPVQTLSFKGLKLSIYYFWYSKIKPKITTEIQKIPKIAASCSSLLGHYSPSIFYCFIR